MCQAIAMGWGTGDRERGLPLAGKGSRTKGGGLCWCFLVKTRHGFVVLPALLNPSQSSGVNGRRTPACVLSKTLQRGEPRPGVEQPRAGFLQLLAGLRGLCAPFSSPSGCAGSVHGCLHLIRSAWFEVTLYLKRGPKSHFPNPCQVPEGRSKS